MSSNKDHQPNPYHKDLVDWLFQASHVLLKQDELDEECNSKLCERFAKECYDHMGHPAEEFESAKAAGRLGLKRTQVIGFLGDKFKLKCDEMKKIEEEIGYPMWQSNLMGCSLRQCLEKKRGEEEKKRQEDGEN